MGKSFAAARLLAVEAAELYRRHLDWPVHERAHAFQVLKDVFTDLGDLAGLEAILREALPVTRKLLGDEHPRTADSLQTLADVLSQEGKLTEAESCYREALGITRKVLGNEGPKTAGSLHNLADVLSREDKLAEAETLYHEELAAKQKAGANQEYVNEPLNNLIDLLVAQHKEAEAEQLFGNFLKPTPKGQPQNVGLLRVRSSFFGRRGRWKEAALDLSKVVEPDGSDDFGQFELAILFLENGDLAGYRARCQKMVNIFGDSKDPGSLDKTAKASLLAAEAGFNPEAVCQLADQAVTLGKDSKWISYFQLVKGLAEYRAGHFASAVGWVGKCIGQPGTVGETSPNENRNVAAYAVLAMSQQRLQHSQEACAALASGVEILNTKLPKLESGDIGDDWIDWLIARILLREARALIPPPPATATK